MINFHRPMCCASLLPPDLEHTNDTILAAMRKLRYPVYATLKLDGIRAVRTSDLFSRTMHLIPNLKIRYRSMKLPPGFDCELFSPTLQYHEIESRVMSEEHDDSHTIHFHAIDWFDDLLTYTMRCNKLSKLSAQTEWPDVHFQEPDRIDNPEDLLEYFLMYEQREGEGICFRLGNSPYKQGRSTLKEQYLVKLARYVRSEVRIIRLDEQMHNKNRTKRNAIGMMDRSSRQSGLVGKGTLGAFWVVNKNGQEFSVGTGVGLTDKLREEIWFNQDKWIGQTIVIKHKPHGTKVKPRMPIFLGKRNQIDIL